MNGDHIAQFGPGSIGKAEHSGSGDIVTGGKNVGAVQSSPEMQALLEEIKKLRSHLDENSRVEVDEAVDSLLQETSPQGRRLLVQRLSGIAALVGELGIPVLSAAKVLLAG